MCVCMFFVLPSPCLCESSRNTFLNLAFSLSLYDCLPKLSLNCLFLLKVILPRRRCVGASLFIMLPQDVEGRANGARCAARLLHESLMSLCVEISREKSLCVKSVNFLLPRLFWGGLKMFSYHCNKNEESTRFVRVPILQTCVCLCVSLYCYISVP